MNRLKFALLAIVVSFASSCTHDIDDTKSVSSVVKRDGAIIDGRLYFQSKQSFAAAYTKYADADEATLAKYFNPLYKKGFHSLRPIVTAENENFLAAQYKDLVNPNPATHPVANPLAREEEPGVGEDDGIDHSNDKDEPFDYLDDLEELIGDDAFAAFLNNSGEIQIDDYIYKYTDVGLFLTKDVKYAILKEWLSSHEISDKPEESTPEDVKEMMQALYPDGSEVIIDEDTKYWREKESDHTPVTSTGDYVPNAAFKASIPDYDTWVYGLKYCDGNPGLFGNIFGDNKICKDKYQNRRRVKTKAFNYNYFIVWHAGVKVKHQYKGWTGFWRIENTSEIRLVVEAAQWEYDFQSIYSPIINTNNQIEAYYTQNFRYVNGQYDTFSYNGNFQTSVYNMNALPNPFRDDLYFEFFGTGNDWLDAQIDNGISNATEAEALNGYFHDALTDYITGQLRDARNQQSYQTPVSKTFAMKFPEFGKVIVQKSFASIGLNAGRRERTFDVGFLVGASSNDGSNWSLETNPNTENFRPKHLKVKIIGAARGGSTWHGSKMKMGF